MLCPRCGKEMQETDRNCFSCGALNPMHPNNKSQSGLIDESSSGEGETKPSYNKTAFIIVNLLLYLFCVVPSVIGILLFEKHETHSLGVFSAVATGVIIVIFSVIFFYILCIEKMLIKAKLPWWGIFIPIYNLFLLFKLAFGNGKMFVILIIFTAVVLLIASIANLDEIELKILSVIPTMVYYGFLIAYNYSLGKSFGMNEALTIFFPVIVIPLIAFSDKYQYERL